MNLVHSSTSVDSHSFLNDSLSFTDHFDNCGETESADYERILNGWSKMQKLYHPDKHKAMVQEGYARHRSIKVYEAKILRLNKSQLYLKDANNREIHACEVL